MISPFLPQQIATLLVQFLRPEFLSYSCNRHESSRKSCQLYLQNIRTYLTCYKHSYLPGPSGHLLPVIMHMSSVVDALRTLPRSPFLRRCTYLSDVVSIHCQMAHSCTPEAFGRPKRRFPRDSWNIQTLFSWLATAHELLIEGYKSQTPFLKMRPFCTTIHTSKTPPTHTHTVIRL